MNTQRRALSANVVALLAGIVVVLFLGGSSVQAQTTSSTTTTNTDSTATSTAPKSVNNTAATVDSSITVKTTGTVSDPSGSIKISGNVIIKARRVFDTSTTAIAPLVLLDFDFSQLTGTTGSGKTLRTYVTGGNHATTLRPFQASDTIVVTVPYFDSTTDGLSASSFLVTAVVNFDTSAGTIVSGTLTYGDNVFKSSGVGTFTVAQ